MPAAVYSRNCWHFFRFAAGGQDLSVPSSGLSVNRGKLANLVTCQDPEVGYEGGIVGVYALAVRGWLGIAPQGGILRWTPACWQPR